MKILRPILMILLAVSMILPLTACEKEEPTAQIDEKIDQATEKAKENIEEAVDKDGPAEEAGEKIDRAVQEVKEETRQAKENAGDAVRY